MVPLQDENKAPEVFPISPYLILPSSRGRFTVYLRQEGRLVLYTTKGEVFTHEHRDRLVRGGVQQVFVEADDRGNYEGYLQENIGTITGDEAIPLHDRTRTWCEATLPLARDIYDNTFPGMRNKKRFARIQYMIEAATAFFNNPEALKELSRFITKGYDAYHHCLSTAVLTGCVLHTYDAVDNLLLTATCVGSLLHDIGKTRFPSHILEKAPEELTPEEKTIYDSHPVVGVSLCSALPLVQESINCILFHHENEDGSGYPSGAMGEDLPFYVKALGACNAFDILTRTNAVRTGLTSYNALKRMQEQKGVFNPDVLRRLILVLSEAEIA